MATQIGIVTAIIGSVTARTADGTIRNLRLGDEVFSDDLILTGPNGAVEFEFSDGSVMDLGRSSQALLDSDVFFPTEFEQTTETTLSDIEALQQSLLDGVDPTQIAEATAAGAGADTDGNEGSDPVIVEYLAPEVTPESGFDTIGVTNEFPVIEEEVGAPVEVEPDLPTVSINDTHECEPGEYEQFLDSAQLISKSVIFQPDPNNHEDGIAVFTITLSEPSANDVTVNFETADGTAIAGGDWFVGNDDYEVTSGSVVIPAGETEANVYVYIYSDYVFEGNETFLVNLSDPVNATIADGEGVGTIVDKAEVFFYNRSEGDVLNAFEDPSSGAKSLVFTVGLDGFGNTSGSPIRVYFQVEEGTDNTDLDLSSLDVETAGDNAGDYYVEIPDGSRTAIVTLPVADDAIVENVAETVRVTLSGTDTANVTASDVTSGTITDLNGNIAITASSPVDEGDAVTFNFALTLNSGSLLTTDTVTVTSLDWAGSMDIADFSQTAFPSSVDLTWNGSHFVGSVTLNSVDDSDFEGSETITVDDGVVAGAVVEVNGVDAEGISVGDASVTVEDGNSGSFDEDADGNVTSAYEAPGAGADSLVFTVSLTDPNNSGDTVRVYYTIDEGTDNVDLDLSGFVTEVGGAHDGEYYVDIIDGEQSETITLPVADDALIEASAETVTVTLTGTDNADVTASGSTSGTITDLNGNIAITASSPVDEGDAVTFNFALTLNSGSLLTTDTVTVTSLDWAGSMDIADFSQTAFPSSVDLTWNGSHFVGSVTLNSVDDSDFEGSETITVDDGVVAGAVVEVNGVDAEGISVGDASVDVVDPDLAEGSVSASISVAEDSIALQNLGSTTQLAKLISVAFTPSDDEVITSITILNIPVGVVITDGTTSVTGTGINSYTTSSWNTLTLTQPLDNSDLDYQLTFNVDILDQDSGATATLNGATLNVLVDAVADAPTTTNYSVTTNGFAYFVAGDSNQGDASTVGATLYRLDLDSGGVTVIGEVAVNGSNNIDYESLSFNSVDGYMYGLVKNIGLVKIDVNGKVTPIVAGPPPVVHTELIDDTGVIGDASGATFANGSLYVTSGNLIYHHDLTSLVDGSDSTTNFVQVGVLASNWSLHGLAFDTANQEFFAIINRNGSTFLYRMNDLDDDPATAFVAQELYNFGNVDIQSLAYGDNGRLWAVDRNSGEVIEISVNGSTVSVSVAFTIDNSSVTGAGTENLTISTKDSTLVKENDQFGITLKATFGDFTDGSESHSFLVAIPTGFTVKNGIARVIGVNEITLTDGSFLAAGTYQKIDVTNIDAVTGVGSATIILTAPSYQSGDPASLEDITIESYALAEEINLAADSEDLSNNTSAEPINVDIQLASGDMVFVGADDVSDEATGGTGNDVLIGLGGIDILSGGDGDDLLFGGTGDDELTGNSGSDTFVWTKDDVDSGVDTVTDFDVALDELNLADLLSDNSHSIAGIGNVGDDLQLQISINGGANDGDVVQTIDLTNVIIVNSAELTLQSLLDTGAINDG